MMFTEVFVPRDALSSAQLERLAQRLTTRGLHDRPGENRRPDDIHADPGVLDFLESITHVVVHEVDVWVAGGRRLDRTQPPRYVVRVWVPGPWRKQLSKHLIDRITEALTETDPDPRRLSREPHAEVHVLGIPDGGYGAFGHPIDDAAMADLLSKSKLGSGQAPDGMAIDPICGATVPLTGPDAVTAEVDGTTHGFCCTHCRSNFLTRQQTLA